MCLCSSDPALSPADHGYITRLLFCPFCAFVAPAQPASTQHLFNPTLNVLSFIPQAHYLDKVVKGIVSVFLLSCVDHKNVATAMSSSI